jgi:hypothetical protein
MALLWAGMVIWFAVDVAGPPDAAPTNNMVAASTNGMTDVTGGTITKEDIAVLRDFAEGH